jgi:hypothetical protein
VPHDECEDGYVYVGLGTFDRYNGGPEDTRREACDGCDHGRVECPACGGLRVRCCEPCAEQGGVYIPLVRNQPVCLDHAEDYAEERRLARVAMVAAMVAL